MLGGSLRLAEHGPDVPGIYSGVEADPTTTKGPGFPGALPVRADFHPSCTYILWVDSKTPAESPTPCGAWALPHTFAA